MKTNKTNKKQELENVLAREANYYGVKIDGYFWDDDILVVTFARWGVTYDQAFTLSYYFDDKGLINLYPIYAVIRLVCDILYYKGVALNDKKSLF